MAKHEVPPEHEVVAAYGSPANAQRAREHLADNGLRDDVVLVEPNIPRLKRAMRRGAAIAVVGLLLGIAIGWVWPGNEEVEIALLVRAGAIGAVVGFVAGAVTPDRRVEAAGETHLAVRSQWASDARRMLRDAGL